MYFVMHAPLLQLVAVSSLLRMTDGDGDLGRFVPNQGLVQIFLLVYTSAKGFFFCIFPLSLESY